MMAPSGSVKLGCADDEVRGAIAAPTAAAVPILSALRRVIFSVIGLGKLIAQDLASRQHFFCEGERALSLCSVIQPAAGEIARSAALPSRFFQDLLKKSDFTNAVAKKPK